MPIPERARDWLTLALAPGLGTRAIMRLREQYPDPSAFLTAADHELREAGLDANTIAALRRPDGERIAACLEWLEAEHHYLISLDDPYYPPLLRRIDDPPPVLFAAGQPDALLKPQVAVVGSRNATAGGLANARAFAATLARAGFAVTSGLAEGVDGAAHTACLDAGGLTVAVAGTGPDMVYPACHRELARRIVGQGVVTSFFPPGTGPRPHNFPARNRVISGMSLGVLVVEAGNQSGSLITARLAAEQGRNVFAIPGSIHNPLARGCHYLLRQGAQLVETADEIVEELRPLAVELAGELTALLDSPADDGLESDACTPHLVDPEYRRLLEAVGFDPTPVDEIIARSQLTTAAVSSMLLMPELDGRVIAHPGGRYSRIGEEHK